MCGKDVCYYQFPTKFLPHRYVGAFWVFWNGPLVCYYGCMLSGPHVRYKIIDSQRDCSKLLPHLPGASELIPGSSGLFWHYLCWLCDKWVVYFGWCCAIMLTQWNMAANLWSNVCRKWSSRKTKRCSFIWCIYTLKLQQNGGHFEDDIFKSIFLKVLFCFTEVCSDISNEIS